MTTIRDATDLANLPPFPGSRRSAPLILEITAPVRSDLTTIVEVERRLNRTYFSCGCHSGASAVGLVLASWAAATLLHRHDVASFLSSTTGWLLISLAAAAFTGKVVGLFVAWTLFRRARRAAFDLINQAQQDVRRHSYERRSKSNEPWQSKSPNG